MPLRCRMIAVRMRSNAAVSPRRNHVPMSVLVFQQKRAPVRRTEGSADLAHARFQVFPPRNSIRGLPGGQRGRIEGEVEREVEGEVEREVEREVEKEVRRGGRKGGRRGGRRARGGRRGGRRGSPPKSFKRKAVGIQTNPTCALYLCLAASEPYSTSIAMP